jgi:heme oxygenase (biliverdin-IX-beta and delta-forming)
MQPGSHNSADILQRLNTSTAEVHERVERRLDIFSPGFDLAGYARLLERFYGYWEPLESRLSQVEELSHPDLGLPGRLKSHLLESDLRALGTEPSRVPRCTELPQLDSIGRALGCLYVLEGSTLGSQLIARHLRERFQLESGCGASFFNAYGNAVGARWLEFRRFLSREAETAAPDDLLNAARQTFEAFDRWLAE